ncbi:MAG: glycosyltransferase family 2 protein [Epsilonproteobacteria bacterium]|nr:glycosyltransferase family 2 protein [Campylobacterota bacterium]NPA88662.1 glycosyltransferase family 2 protein [Campylobacterota bacterium]
MPKISVIMPTLNEEKFIGRALESLLETSLSPEEMEILIVDGGSRDRTREIVKEYQKRYPFIHLLENPHKIVPIAMNIGIKKARGEYIVRVDAHSIYPPDYIAQLVKYHQQLGADNVGGRVVTQLAEKSPTAVAIANTLNDKLGVGSSFRTISDLKIRPVDTVPFGCYKKELLEKIGLYNPKLVRNQDIELNKRIIRNGGKIYLIPQIEIGYFPRTTFKAFAKNNFLNGYWNILTPYYTGNLKSLSLRHFVPLGFVATLFLSLILTPFYPPVFFIFVGVGGIYLLLISFRSWQIKKGTTFFHQLWAFLTLHFSYGVGSLWGIVKVLGKMVKINKKEKK